jgi:hypothetical protein
MKLESKMILLVILLILAISAILFITLSFLFFTVLPPEPEKVNQYKIFQLWRPPKVGMTRIERPAFDLIDAEYGGWEYLGIVNGGEVKWHRCEKYSISDLIKVEK